MWHYSETRHVLITYHVLTAAYCYQPLTASLQPSNSLLVSGQGADGNCGHAASAASIGNCSSARVFFKTSWPWKGWILWWHAQKESFVSGKKLYSKHFAESHGDNLHSQPLGYNAWCLFHTKSHAPTKILRNKSAVCWGNHLTASWKWTFPLSRVWQARQASNMKNQAILILIECSGMCRMRTWHEFTASIRSIILTSGSAADQVRALENSLPLRTVRSCQSSGRWAMALCHVDIQAVKLDASFKLSGRQSKQLRSIKYTSSSGRGHDTMDLVRFLMFLQHLSTAGFWSRHDKGGDWCSERWQNVKQAYEPCRCKGQHKLSCPQL